MTPETQAVLRDAEKAVKTNWFARPLPGEQWVLDGIHWTRKFAAGHNVLQVQVPQDKRVVNANGETFTF